MEEGKNRDFTYPTIKRPAQAQKIGLKIQMHWKEKLQVTSSYLSDA